MSESACPCCGRPFAEPATNTPPPGGFLGAEEGRSGGLVAELAADCRRRGLDVSAGGWVSADAAAHILGVTEKTLANRRATDRSLRFRKVGRAAQYCLADLAKLIQAAG